MDEIKLIFDEDYVVSAIENETDYGLEDIKDIDELIDEIQLNLKEDEEVIEAINNVIIGTANWYIKKHRKDKRRDYEEEEEDVNSKGDL